MNITPQTHNFMLNQLDNFLAPLISDVMQEVKEHQHSVDYAISESVEYYRAMQNLIASQERVDYLMGMINYVHAISELLLTGND